MLLVQQSGCCKPAGQDRQTSVPRAASTVQARHASGSARNCFPGPRLLIYPSSTPASRPGLTVTHQTALQALQCCKGLLVAALLQDAFAGAKGQSHRGWDLQRCWSDLSYQVHLNQQRRLAGQGLMRDGHKVHDGELSGQAVSNSSVSKHCTSSTSKPQQPAPALTWMWAGSFPARPASTRDLPPTKPLLKESWSSTQAFVLSGLGRRSGCWAACDLPLLPATDSPIIPDKCVETVSSPHARQMPLNQVQVQGFGQAQQLQGCQKHAVLPARDCW